jgi:hypothetical protein
LTALLGAPLLGADRPILEPWSAWMISGSPGLVFGRVGLAFAHRGGSTQRDRQLSIRQAGAASTLSGTTPAPGACSS